jgi:riboflavin kinase / FMN adenylyltransferase
MADNKQIPENAREALSMGNLNEAFRILHTPYSLYGHVVHGQHLGTKLGFPTANLQLEDPAELLLAYGIYAVKIKYDGRIYDGVANIGIRPTLKDHSLAIEVNIFDFNEDLYGKEIRVFFLERIRDEMKFPGLEALKEQIARDKEKAVDLLAGWHDFDPDTQ